MSGIMDPYTILNQDLVERAIEIARPAIREFLQMDTPSPNKGNPVKAVAICVVHPVLAKPITQVVSLVHDSTIEIEKIAEWKATKSSSIGITTGELTTQRPWDHQPGDFLYPGSYISGDLSVGVSGITGDGGDSTIAKMVGTLIEGICILKRNQLYLNDVRRLQ